MRNTALTKEKEFIYILEQLNSFERFSRLSHVLKFSSDKGISNICIIIVIFFLRGNVILMSHEHWS